MSDNQRRVFIDTVQLYDAFMEVSEKSRSYRGGMHWKKSKGREYLFRSRDRYGHGKSLGRRSPETEKILSEFRRGKQELSDRLKTLKDRLKEQSRFCKAAMIQRVPRLVTSILRLLHQQNILGRNVMVIGTNALYAYEAAAGLFFERQIMATMDILWDIRPKLTLVSDKNAPQTGLIDILRKADRSFEPVGKQSFRAVNQNGYMVDLVKPVPQVVFKMGGPDDLVAAEIMNLQWLVSSPKFSQTVIGDDGYPALMIVPDPRAFALHKLWLSQQPAREPIKKKRDQNQGLAVARLVVRYLPQYRFDSSALRMFPQKVVEDARKSISDAEVPVGLDLL